MFGDKIGNDLGTDVDNSWCKDVGNEIDTDLGDDGCDDFGNYGGKYVL